MCVPGKLFQPSPMFKVKAVACPSEAPFRLSFLRETKLEMLVRDQHLLRTLVNYGRKKLYNLCLREDFSYVCESTVNIKAGEEIITNYHHYHYQALTILVLIESGMTFG
jgi:hypothetical protein